MNYKIEDITKKYPELPYMRHEQALYMREIILDNKFSKLCELGHLHGKSSIYLASILEEQGFGHLWSFDLTYTTVTPCINDLLREFDLNDLVTTIVTQEGYTWDLVKFKNETNQTFDFCYIDGGHSFESTSLAFLLIDKMLDKNGIIIFDDYNWTVNSSISTFGNSILQIPMYNFMTDHQRKQPQVKMACDVFIDDSKYELIDNKKYNWAIYRKRD
jgi:predicted O-methyltransferase YrrM